MVPAGLEDGWGAAGLAVEPSTPACLPVPWVFRILYGATKAEENITKVHSLRQRNVQYRFGGRRAPSRPSQRGCAPLLCASTEHRPCRCLVLQHGAGGPRAGARADGDGRTHQGGVPRRAAERRPRAQRHGVRLHPAAAAPRSARVVLAAAAAPPARCPRDANLSCTSSRWNRLSA